jgi:hypothetical protein
MVVISEVCLLQESYTSPSLFWWQELRSEGIFVSAYNVTSIMQQKLTCCVPSSLS